MANWATRPEGKFNDRAKQEIKVLIDMLPRAESIIEASKTLTPTSNPDDLMARFALTLDVPPRDLGIFFNALENIRGIQEQLGSEDKAVARLARSTESPLSDEINANTPEIKSALSKYSVDNPVSVTFKAQRVAYTRERLFQDAEIMTDVRPVFNSQGDKIDEFVITHDLILRWYSDGKILSQYFSLDNADILDFRKACDRAIIKARTLKTCLGKISATEIMRDEETSTD